MSDILHVGWVREDRGHDLLVKTVAGRVAVEQHAWLDGVLGDVWSWKGPHNEDEPKLSGRIDVAGPGGKPLRLHGRIGGEPLLPEASMVRTVLTAFERRDPVPELVIIARDGDGHGHRRRSGFEQAHGAREWPFPVILAMPEPECEAWFICGFEPRTSEERARLDAIAAELSFDPTKQPERTTSRPNDAPTDTKRILGRLTDEDAERTSACLDHALDELARRGAKVGLERLIADLRAHLPSLFTGPRS